MMNHTPPLPVKLGKTASAYWSLEPTGKLMVFVHGFNGNATKTWLSLPYGLLEEKMARGIDFLFYGYESLRQGGSESGVQLYDDLTALWKTPGDFINNSPYDFRAEEFRYTSLTLVAHSLGAGVARQALIEHFRNGNPWGTDIDLILFAPAHRGANGAKLLGATLAGGGLFGTLLAGFLELRYQSIRDLQPGSQFLLSLLEESRRALESTRPSGAYMKARKVIWAAADPVVTNERFLEDPTAVRIARQTHTTVCKPNASYADPIQHIKEVLI